MAKSMYSLILSDEIIDEVDRLALRLGLSRSAAVNKILAEYVSYVTPEKRIDTIFRQLEGLLSGDSELVPFFIPNRTSMSMKSSLDYRYRPTLKYDVLLYRDPGETIGELTVSFRTQSETLLALSEQFFLLWKNIEDTYITRYHYGTKASYVLSDGKFVRTLSLVPGRDDSAEQLAEAISRYVRLFDSQLKGFITGDRSGADIEENYKRYLLSSPAIY